MLKTEQTRAKAKHNCGHYIQKDINLKYYDVIFKDKPLEYDYSGSSGFLPQSKNM